MLGSEFEKNMGRAKRIKMIRVRDDSGLIAYLTLFISNYNETLKNKSLLAFFGLLACSVNFVLPMNVENIWPVK